MAWAAERQPQRPGGIPGRFIVRRNVATASAIVGERRAPPGAILAVCTGYRKMVCTNCVCSGAHCAAVGGSAALRMRRALAGSDRLAGWQYLRYVFYGVRPPSLSFRGAKRRGNLAGPGWITGKFRQNRDCLPEIATAPSGPRNDKSGGLAPLNLCRNHCQPAWRSLSAATFFSRAAALYNERRCRRNRCIPF